MSVAYVTNEGLMVHLDAKAPSRIVITAADVQDPEKLARLLEDAHRRVQELERRDNRSRVYFRDVVITDDTGAVQYRFEHRFGGRVNYSAVDWTPSGIYQGPPQFDVDRTSTGTDEDALVLLSYWTGTMTLAVEEAG